MDHSSTDREGLTVHVMPYTHADIAWVHTRDWHIDRYVRVMDEVLRLFETDPEYHYYVDTWVELIRPYVERRPNAVATIRRRVREGRLAVCGGQYGNVRSTAIGNEAQVRNMQLGMRRWKELAPEVEFRVHSNIDVTFGHTQMPQLLRLAGIEAYFVMRPLAALDAQGVPRAFIWQGLSGDRVLVYRDTGVGLFQEHERPGPTWDADWPAAVRHIWAAYLAEPARVGTSAIGLTVGVDDSRPDRFSYSDVPADYGALIRTWNERELSAMQYGTPDTLVAALQRDEHLLEVVEAVLDPTDVSFNIALHGRRGIWWLREQADRLLVQAEIVRSLAHLASGTPYPEADFTSLWEQLLSWTPHAVQWLFREDWQQGELALRNVADAATSEIRRGAAALVDGCLPADAGCIAVLNTLPGPSREIVPLWIVNTDLTRGFAGLRDAHGRDVTFQVIGFPVPGAEVGVLAQADLPGCGWTTLTVEWTDAPSGIPYAGAVEHWRSRYGLSERRVIDDGCCTLASDCVAITLQNGRLASVEDLATGGVRLAPEGAGFLEPVSYAVQRTGWSSDSIPDDPAGFVPECVRWDENGPLRWRVTRTGTTGGFWVRQHLDLQRGERAVRSTIEFLNARGDSDELLALSVPLAEGAAITADIPFGVEPRPVDSIRYGISERSIPGLFWGRTWAAATDGSGTIALVAADGDKLFRAFGSPRRLAHIIAQKTRLFEEGWEAHIATHDVGGSQVFHHVMPLSDGADMQRVLIGLAERLRHPIMAQWAPADRIGEEREMLAVTPDTACLSAMMIEEDHLIVRVVQMAPAGAEARILLPVEAAAAELTDFRGRVLPTPVTLDGKTACFPILPWQVCTLRVSLAR